MYLYLITIYTKIRHLLFQLIISLDYLVMYKKRNRIDKIIKMVKCISVKQFVMLLYLYLAKETL